jgi:phospholipid/cholesterol/gamma-HCH transport system ATP-binding protein
MLHGGLIRWTGRLPKWTQTPDPYVQQFIHGSPAEGFHQCVMY